MILCCGNNDTGIHKKNLKTLFSWPRSSITQTISQKLCAIIIMETANKKLALAERQLQLLSLLVHIYVTHCRVSSKEARESTGEAILPTT